MPSARRTVEDLFGKDIAIADWVTFAASTWMDDLHKKPTKKVMRVFFKTNNVWQSSEGRPVRSLVFTFDNQDDIDALIEGLIRNREEIFGIWNREEADTRDMSEMRPDPD